MQNIQQALNYLPVFYCVGPSCLFKIFHTILAVLTLCKTIQSLGNFLECIHFLSSSLQIMFQNYPTERTTSLDDSHSHSTNLCKICGH